MVFKLSQILKTIVQQLIDKIGKDFILLKYKKVMHQPLSSVQAKKMVPL